MLQETRRSDRISTGIARLQREADLDRNRKLGLTPGVSPDTIKFIVTAVREGVFASLDPRTQTLISAYYTTETHAPGLIQAGNVSTRRGVIRIIRSGMEQLWTEMDAKDPTFRDRHPKEKVIKMKDNHTPAAVKRAGEAQRGKELSLQEKIKMSKAKQGQRQSEATKKRRKEKMLDFWQNQDPQYKQQQAEAISKGRKKERSVLEKFWLYAQRNHLVYKIVNEGFITHAELGLISAFCDGDKTKTPNKPLVDKFTMAVAYFA